MSNIYLINNQIKNTSHPKPNNTPNHNHQTNLNSEVPLKNTPTSKASEVLLPIEI
jgi:hypothetical protein